MPVRRGIQHLPAMVLLHDILPLLGYASLLRLSMCSDLFQDLCDRHWRQWVRSQTLSEHEREWVVRHVRVRIRRLCPSIVFRRFRKDRLKATLLADLRLLPKQKQHLLSIASGWDTATERQRNEFQWYVDCVRPYRPTAFRSPQVFFSCFRFPHTEFTLRTESNEYVMRVRTEPSHQIVVLDRKRTLVGCIDEHQRLWPTVLWSREIEEWIDRIVRDPLRCIGRYCLKCPVCGKNADQPEAWSIQCCLLYTTWIRDLVSKTKSVRLLSGSNRFLSQKPRLRPSSTTYDVSFATDCRGGHQHPCVPAPFSRRVR